MTTKISIFQGKQIRKTIHNNEWWFSVADVIQALTNSVNVKDYIKKMKKRDNALNVNWGTNCPLLQIEAPDGKIRKTSCANTEGMFHIIQSIPSKKVEKMENILHCFC